MADDKFPLDDKEFDPSQPSEGAAKFIGGGSGRFTLGPSNLKNYDRMGDPDRTGKTLEDLSSRKGNTFKKENEGFVDMNARRTAKDDPSPETPSPAPAMTDVAPNSSRTQAVNSIEQRMLELKQQPSVTEQTKEVFKKNIIKDIDPTR